MPRKTWKKEVRTSAERREIKKVDTKMLYKLEVKENIQITAMNTNQLWHRKLQEFPR